MKKFASLCLLFICFLLILFLSGSPLINLSHLNQSLFSNHAIVGSPVVKAEFADDFDTLGGNPDVDPLRVEVMNNGSLAVFTWQPVSPGSSTYDYENRYFDGFCWGSNLFLSIGTEKIHLYSDFYQDLPSIGYGDPNSVEDIGLGVQSVIDNSIVTTWALLGGACELRQTITYLPGSSSVSKTFAISHTGSQTVSLTDLRFMHGGDIYFGDEASCAFDVATQTITVQNQDMTIGGSFAMTPDPANPLDSWFAGEIVDLLDATDSGDLPGTIANYSEDIGVQLQWDRDVLAAGETWTITLVERFTGFDPETAATTEQTDETTATTTTSDPEATTTAVLETMTTTVPEDPEVTTTEVHETSLTQTTTTTVMSQIATYADPTTTTSTDRTLPATGEDGACQFITGGMLLLIAALFCWFKRLQSCH